jgi:hypothetical protein
MKDDPPPSEDVKVEEKPPAATHLRTRQKSVQFNESFAEDARSVRSTKSTTSQQSSARSRAAVKAMGLSASFKQQMNLDDREPPKYLFYPFTKGYMCWFVWTVIWSILTIFFETYSVAFLPGGGLPPSNPASVVEYCFSTVFVIDIFVNFNLAYTTLDDVVIFDRKRIMVHYLKKVFWIDVIGVFPFYHTILAARDLVGVDSEQTRYLHLVSLTRLVRLHRVFKAFEMMQYSTKISLMWYTMIRNFGGALVWTHFAACTMFFIAKQQSFQDSWLEEPTPTETNFDLYVTSLYWSIVTFATGTCQLYSLFGFVGAKRFI